MVLSASEVSFREFGGDKARDERATGSGVGPGTAGRIPVMSPNRTALSRAIFARADTRDPSPGGAVGTSPASSWAEGMPHRTPGIGLEGQGTPDGVGDEVGSWRTVGTNGRGRLVSFACFLGFFHRQFYSPRTVAAEWPRPLSAGTPPCPSRPGLSAVVAQTPADPPMTLFLDTLESRRSEIADQRGGSGSPDDAQGLGAPHWSKVPDSEQTFILGLLNGLDWVRMSGSCVGSSQGTGPCNVRCPTVADGQRPWLPKYSLDTGSLLARTHVCLPAVSPCFAWPCPRCAL